MTPRRWRPILVILMMFGFFGPWVPSCTSSVSTWGNVPHYLSDYVPISAGVPTGDLGPGYFHPKVYFGFETVWIYLLGFGHSLGIHTFFFLIGLGAVLVILYSFMSLSIFFYGTEAKTRLLGRAKSTAILSLIGMALGGLESFRWSEKGVQPWDYAGYTVTFAALVASLIFEFRNQAAAQSVRKPTQWFRASVTLIVCSLFLPGVWVSTGSLPSSTQSPPTSVCEALNAFVLPADKWNNMGKESLMAWVEASPAFDGLDSHSYGNNLTLTWKAYTHSLYYGADFKDGRLRSISAEVVYRAFLLDSA